MWLRVSRSKLKLRQRRRNTCSTLGQRDTSSSIIPRVPRTPRDTTFTSSVRFCQCHALWNNAHAAYKGSRTVLKFRSVNEFVPHAIWLYSNNPNQLCGCRYCSNAKSQGEITQQFGLPTHTKTDSPPVVIRRIVKPVLAPAPDQRTVAQRDADLRAAARSSRRYRLGEVVWCQIDPPIAGPAPDICIDWWPAIIRDIRLKKIVTGRQPAASPSKARSEYVVKELHTYKVQLLGVLYFQIVPETMMLPYLAWVPGDPLFQCLKDPDVYIPSPLSEDLRELSTFYPMPTSASSIPEPIPVSASAEEQQATHPPAPQQGSFREGTAPFGLALQIAAYITQYWCLTDEWEFKPKPSKQTSRIFEPPAESTSAAAGAAATAEAVPSPKQARPAAEFRYQGIWWGCERIWQDDLVRIQPYRDQMQLDELLPASALADTRTLFMLLSAVFIDHPGEFPKGKIAGPLYELAPADWVDDSRPASPSKQPQPDQPLSSPLPPRKSTMHYALPPPPEGFVFRCITPPGFEVVLDIAFLAGRYYGDLLTSAPGMHRLRQLGLQSMLEPGAEVNAVHLEPVLSLGGLSPSFRSTMSCIEWFRTRAEMLTQADKTSREKLYEHFVGLQQEAARERASVPNGTPINGASAPRASGSRPDDPMVID